MDADKILDAVKAKYEGAKHYGHGIAQDWAEGRKSRAVGKVILPCLPIIPLCLIVWLIVKNWDAIVTFFIGLAAVVCLAGGALSKVAERKRAEAERQERLRQEAIRENARTADATYTKMAKVVYAIARDLGSPDIVPPTRLSAIYSPGRMVLMNDGAVQLGLYLLQKSEGATIDDEDSLTDLMQTKADQMLKYEEFPEIPKEIIYHGHAYSGLIIHKVCDNGNTNFIEVYTVLTNEAYLRYKLDGELDKDTPTPSVDRRDIRY